MGECLTIGNPETRPGAREHLFCIRDWAAWSPGRETEVSWRDWAAARSPETAVAEPDRKTTPMILRRRVSTLGQAALRAAWGLSDISDARFVLASRHGEFGRTLSILDALANGAGVSPADFTLSVHNALIGLLSIAASNRQGHTAISAGRSTFAMGFVEAMACLVEQPQKPVVLIYFDEALPAPFDDFDEPSDQPLALALTLATDGAGETFGFSTASGVSNSPRAEQALDFLRFLLTDTPKLSSPGINTEWLWRRHAEAA